MIYKQADVTKRDQIKHVLDFAVEIFGKIDVLYNNAGVMHLGNLSEQNYDAWQQMVDINIMGVLNGIGEVLPIMRKQNSGLIIATDSIAGHTVYPTYAVYNGTKFAVRAIMEELRKEERKNGIRSSIVSPGLVNTDLINTIDNQKLTNALNDGNKTIAIDPIDVANSILYIIDQPDHVTISEVIIRPSSDV